MVPPISRVPTSSERLAWASSGTVKKRISRWGMLIIPATEATAREMDENKPWLRAPNS